MTEENYTPEEEKPKNRKSQIKWTPWLIALVAGLFLLLIVLVLKKFSFEPLKKKTKKGEFIAKYKVDKKTFNKWIKYFCKDIFPDYEVYLKIRKFTYTETVAMTAILGLGEDLGEHRCKNKGEIVEECEGSYRSLRESIQLYPDKYGISPEAFAKISVFPPKIAERIISQYD